MYMYVGRVSCSIGVSLVSWVGFSIYVYSGIVHASGCGSTHCSGCVVNGISAN